MTRLKNEELNESGERHKNVVYLISAKGLLFKLKNPIWISLGSTWNLKTTLMALKTHFTGAISKLCGMRNLIMCSEHCPRGFPWGPWNTKATRAFAFPLCKSIHTVFGVFWRLFTIKWCHRYTEIINSRFTICFDSQAATPTTL